MNGDIETVMRTHTWDLPSSRGSHLRFVILQQLDKVPDELLPHKLRAYDFCELPQTSLTRTQFFDDGVPR